jgi:drug/metabolite transporter (DMT)-like permease
MAVFHERPSVKTFVAMGLVMAAVFLLGWDAADHPTGEGK